MKLFNDFKVFALKGNLLDTAVGIIIGLAFTKVVTSLVNDIIMPPVGKLIGSIDFSNLFVALSSQSFRTLSEAKAAGVPTLNYGIFLQSCMDFFIIAAAVFVLVRIVANLRRSHSSSTQNTPPTSEEIVLLREIRDALQNNK